MCYELMYSKRTATREARKSEPEKKAAPVQAKAREPQNKVPEPA
jgi:hypothetical protein